jgi:hypothetical protein
MEIIITNNPMVRDKILDRKLEFCEADNCLAVFNAVRDKIHLGHRLVTHPLSGSVKPGETPYKTVVITAERGELDEKDLSLIEESIQTCMKLQKSIVKKQWSEKILADFQLIDYDLIFG